MPNTVGSADFSGCLLITPERLHASVRAALAVLPPAVLRAEFVGGEVLFVLGVAEGQLFKFSPSTAALLCELCRVGFRPASNSNGQKPLPRTYLKVIPGDAIEDTFVFLRAIADAGEGEGVKSAFRIGDHSPEHIVFEGHARANRSARELLFQHADRLAAGALSADIDKAEYLANLTALLEMVDGEMSGAVPTSTR